MEKMQEGLFIIISQYNKFGKVVETIELRRIQFQAIKLFLITFCGLC